MMHWMNGGGGYMWFGWIFWLILLGFIIWAVVMIINKNQISTRNNLPQGESAIDILKKRFAKGEITRDQFDRMKIALKE